MADKPVIGQKANKHVIYDMYTGDSNLKDSDVSGSIVYSLFCSKILSTLDCYICDSII